MKSMINKLKDKVKGANIKAKALTGINAFKSFSFKKKMAFILAGILLLCFLMKLIGIATKDTSTYNLIETTVERGDIKVTLSGSSIVEPVEMYSVVSTVKGDILNDYIEIGQEVKEGDLLYVIDSSDAEKNISKAELSYEKTLLSYNQNVESVENLTITSPASGVITTLNIKEMDNVNNNGKVATIVDYKNLEAKLPFLSDDAKMLQKGDKVRITVAGSNLELDGNIKKINTGTYISENGALVSDVTIEFINPGAIKEDAVVTAISGDIACNGSGNVKYSNLYEIVAKTSGEVTGLFYSEGDKIEKGDILAILDNDSVIVNAKSSALSLEDSKLSVEEAYETLDEYNIKSMIDGTVISKTSKAGDTIDGSDGMKTLAVIADVSKLVCSLNIDELDISKVQVGQEVTVTADAVEGKTFKGVVKTKSIMGTTSNNTTSYPIEIEISEYEDLIPGMSVNVEIVVEEAKNVLLVPISAVQRGNMILVKENSSSFKNSKNNVEDKLQNYKDNKEGSEEEKNIKENGNKNENENENEENNVKIEESNISDTSIVKEEKENNDNNKMQSNTRNQKLPSRMLESDVDGYTYVMVELGVSDDNCVEIISGLNEGDEIAYKATKTGTDSLQTNASSQGFGMGGMPSGMPMGGGMQGGGNRMRNIGR